jgi:hypothetical protein
VPHAPSVENRDSGFEQPLRHAAIPVFRQHSQGSEEPERSPARGYVRSDQAATFACREHLDVGRAPARRNQIAIAHEVERIRQSQKRSKRQPDNTARLFEFTLFE